MKPKQKHSKLTPEQKRRLDESHDPLNTALEILREDPEFQAMSPKEQKEVELALTLEMSTDPNSRAYDPEFDRQIRAKHPDWFESVKNQNDLPEQTDGTNENETDLRPVVNGERLSGHSRSSTFPTFLICSGEGPADGAVMCSIGCFHWADVRVKRNKVELWFEGQTRIVIEDAVVLYSPADEEA